jgi:hypothetical protein
LKPRKNGLAVLKGVEQWTATGEYKIAEYASTIEASRKVGVRQGHISECALGKRPSCGGFTWRFQENNSDLDNEEWRTNDEVKRILRIGLSRPNKPISERAIDKIRVSNKGRVRTANGIKTKGTINIRNPQYRWYGHIGVHQLVWAAFGNRLLNPGEVICHTDGLPLDEQGCCSNAIEHLRADSQSNNMKESWKIGNNSHRKRRKIML